MIGLAWFELKRASNLYFCCCFVPYHFHKAEPISVSLICSTICTEMRKLLFMFLDCSFLTLCSVKAFFFVNYCVYSFVDLALWKDSSLMLETLSRNRESLNHCLSPTLMEYL